MFISPLFSVINILLGIERRISKPVVRVFEKSGGIEYPVDVYDNENTLKCKIEIKNSENGVKVLLRYKENTMESPVLPTTQKAINEIAKKLRESGLTMKICSDCAHFGFKPNSGSNPLKGLCSNKEKMTEDIQVETMIMDSCEHFKPLSSLNNVVSINKNEEQE